MTRNINREMYDYLPRYYEEVKETIAIVDAESAEVTSIQSAVKNVLDQFYINTATWGLARWESICGIKTDESKPYDQRRSVLKSRLRGIGTVTDDIVKSVAEAYYNGEVSLAENNANYEISITFISKRGVPPNLDDIKNAIKNIVPAHLAVIFKFTYLTWDELDGLNLIWTDIEDAQMTWDELEVLDPNETVIVRSSIGLTMSEQ